jgi:Amidases related to nicotinamidase
MTNTLLIIDPQNDFCDPKGTLAVPGAKDDCQRLIDMIKKLGASLSSIHVTMDTHHLFHIAHPIFWLDKNGKMPAPFTIITSEKISSGEYHAAVQQYQHYALDYVTTLEKTGKYSLCIWPPHCLIGSWGHDIYSPLSDALIEWECSVPGRIVDYTYKGSNVRTEHYSAIRAEVSDAADPSSRTNFALIERLKSADNIIVAGEALSHCVANTVRDLITCMPADKLVVLTDASSNVPGFENLGKEFSEEVEAIGVRLMTTAEFLVTV